MTSVNRYKFSKSQSNGNSPFLGKSYSPPLQSHTIIINGKQQRHINGSSEALNKEVESICTYDVDGNPKVSFFSKATYGWTPKTKSKMLPVKWKLQLRWIFLYKLSSVCVCWNGIDF